MTVSPASHAPFATPEEYILSWTDLIWDDFGLGRLEEHYAKDLVVHTAYGPIRGMETVLRASLVKKATFPNRIGTAEDVICEARGDDAFISHHRVFHSGKQEGFGGYGLPSTRQSESRNLAICLVRDGLVVEEWVVRDEFRVVTTLGLDPEAVARSLAFTDEPGGLFDRPVPADVLRGGESGPRPAAHAEEAQFVLEFIEQVWNGRHLERIGEFAHPHLFCETTRARIITRHRNYQIDLIQMLAAFPDFHVEPGPMLHGDDHIFVEVRCTGTQQGEFAGIPSTGRRFDLPRVANLFEFEGDQLVCERVYLDVAEMTRQLTAPE